MGASLFKYIDFFELSVQLNRPILSYIFCKLGTSPIRESHCADTDRAFKFSSYL